ncbi:AAA family ATPase, partial [Frankia sp. Cas3]|uniref:AAA family ATPase n=1 Tax=Frankia sp. Cas3 TaxID=3073926 RepID=UPI002AD4110A
MTAETAETARMVSSSGTDLDTPDGQASTPQTGRRARIVWGTEEDPEPVIWAWEDDGRDLTEEALSKVRIPAPFGRIPAGTLAIAAGREGTGKSSFGIWLAAQITRGTLPGSFYGEPRRVLYVAVEDSWKHTLLPRMIAADVDRSMIGRFDVIVDKDTEMTLSLPADNALLEAEVIRHGIALVVIDPLMSAIGEKIDTHNERNTRTALDPLARLADRSRAVILGIAHFNKGNGSDVAS